MVLWFKQFFHFPFSSIGFPFAIISGPPLSWSYLLALTVAFFLESGINTMLSPAPRNLAEEQTVHDFLGGCGAFRLLKK